MEGIITWSIFASWFFNRTLSIYLIMRLLKSAPISLWKWLSKLTDSQAPLWHLILNISFLRVFLLFFSFKLLKRSWTFISFFNLLTCITSFRYLFISCNAFIACYNYVTRFLIGINQRLIHDLNTVGIWNPDMSKFWMVQILNGSLA